TATDKAVPGPAKVNTDKYTAPGSSLTVALGDIGAYSPPDWFPGDHPSMPPIVAHGDMMRTINACSFCHLPTGSGRAENADVQGLPVEYFKQQIQEFKSGQRVSSDPRKTNTATMIAFAKAMTDDEVNQAAAYFAASKVPSDWIKVVEAATVPKTVG